MSIEFLRKGVEKKLISKRMGYQPVASKPLSEKQRISRDVVLGLIDKKTYQYEFCSCPGCGSDEAFLVAERDMYGLPIGTVICKKCELMYSSPRLDRKSLFNLYSTEYRSLDRPESETIEDFFQFQERKGTIILSKLADFGVAHHLKEGDGVFEFGCGAGGILSTFKKKGFQTYGIDLGEEYLNFGRKKANLDLAYGDENSAFEYLKASGSKTKLIILEAVLEHMSDPKTFLTSLRKAADPSALFYVGVPGVRDLEAHFHSNFLPFLQIPHLLYFELSTLHKVMDEAGFQMIEGNEHIRGVFQAKGGPLKVKNTDIARNTDTILEYLTEQEKKFRHERIWGMPARIGWKLRIAAFEALKKIMGERYAGLRDGVKTLIGRKTH